MNVLCAGYTTHKKPTTIRHNAHGQCIPHRHSIQPYSNSPVFLCDKPLSIVAQKRGVIVLVHSSAQASGTQPDPVSVANRATSSHPILETLNESTKWAAGAIVMGTLLYRRDLPSAWWIVGSVLAAMLCRILKFAINESRPPIARKADPGMPSAHANSLGYLATSVSLWTLWTSLGSSYPNYPATLSFVLGVPLVGMFFAWLRVILGFHTKAQVVVGWLVGSGFAAWWTQLGIAAALPNLQSHPETQWKLYVATALAIVLFLGVNLKRWISDFKTRF